MNDEGLTAAFLSFKEGITAIVRRVVGNKVDVEDIVHEAYLRSLIASRKQAVDSPKAFIARTARNLALNHIRLLSVKNTDSLSSNDPVDTYFEEIGVEDQVEAQRRFRDFCLAVEQLPVECRRVFTLKQVYGFTQKEISRRLGISEKTVEYHVSKGLLQCRRNLRAMKAGQVSPGTKEGAANRAGTVK